MRARGREVGQQVIASRTGEPLDLEEGGDLLTRQFRQLSRDLRDVILQGEGGGREGDGESGVNFRDGARDLRSAAQMLLDAITNNPTTLRFGRTR